MPTTYKNNTQNNQIRSATRMETNRAKAVAFSSVIVIAALALTITLTAIMLNRPKDNIPGDEVSGAIVFAVPVANYTSILKDSSLTELQYNETMERWEAHKGVTIEAPLNAPVVATFAGTVTNISDHAVYGRQVTVEHRDGLKTVYGNLDKNVNVSVGDNVVKGQKIGSIGQTGSIEFTDTPHVRIEVYKDGKRVDPNDYIDFPAK